MGDLQTYLFPSVAPSTDGPGQGPTEGPGQGPTEEPTDDFSCKGDDVDLTLKNGETKTCFKISRNQWCDKKVENPVGNKNQASDFCTSCGCGESPPVTTATPTSPPTDGFSCKGDDVDLTLKNEGTKTCFKIKNKKFCNEKVQTPVGNKKRAFDFCTSCGCGGGGDVGDDDDDKCVDSKKKFQLNFGEVKCKDLQTNQCNKKVVGDPDNKKARDYCPQKCEISGCEIENVIGV